MLLSDVVVASTAVAATSSRNAKRDLLAEVLRRATPGREVEVVTDYLAGALPQRRVGVSWRGLRSLPEPRVTPTLSVLAADDALTALTTVQGHGSATQRAAAVAALFGAATAAEQRWLRGLITGEMRQGAGDGTVLAAIAAAAAVPEAAVRRAVMLGGFPGPVAAAALAGGEAALAGFGLQVLRPVRPMLAASAPDVAAGFGGDGTPRAIDSKLDGIRIQAHKAGDEIRLFTRSLEDITERLPEVVALVRGLPADSLVLDGEVLAETAERRPEPFQVTGARTSSSTDPALGAEHTPLSLYLFDLLHLDGVDLIDAPARDRWAALARLAPDLLVPRLVTDDPTEAQAFFTDRVAAGHEGVVIKKLDAPYAAGRREAAWTKIKPRHTVDLVVLAVEHGSGRRRGLLSNIHLGARDDDTGELIMLGKTFKGMTDEMLRWQTQRFTELATGDDGWVVTLRPEQVVEIAFDGVQTSRRYPGGIALRFARVLRYRDDKTVEQIDTLQAIRALA